MNAKPADSAPATVNADTSLDPASLSTTVRPQDDFFRYVNGPWLDKHVILDDRAADGSFYKLRDQAEEHVKAIIEESGPQSIIGALYASFMDTERVDALGRGRELHRRVARPQRDDVGHPAERSTGPRAPVLAWARSRPGAERRRCS